MRLFMSDQFFDLFTKLPKDAQQGFVEFKDKFRECSTTNGLHLESTCPAGIELDCL